MRSAIAGLALLAAAAGALAQDAAPVVKEISFLGNEVTQPSTMLREMQLQVGDAADPAAIERARQGVQDLGLFRSVQAQTEPVDGGVRLVIKVKEKLYILPLPRADASSDGGYGYGAELRWYNVWGLNHTFTPYFERRQPSEGDNDPEKRGLQTRTQLRYSAPFVFGEFGMDAAAGYFKTPYLTPLEYDQTTTFLTLTLNRKLTEGDRSQGWLGRAGLSWANEEHSGSQVPTDPADVARGQALAAVAGATYRDLRYNVYSDEGTTFGATVQNAAEGVASDYDYTSWSLHYARYTYVGETPHQNLNFLFNAQARHDGAYGGDSLAIGGTETVRGFEPETVKGDAFYAASAEYLRPVFRNSIRVLAVVDAGNAFVEPGDANLDKVYVSAGIGVRVRFQAFVALDLEIGIAWPLNGGGPRLFASKV
ncbi:MAG: ShlB/FhaC/HecB family hemolysin secretion/activation protein [Nevskiaceae bacterium]